MLFTERVVRENVFRVTDLVVHTETGDRFAVYSPLDNLVLGNGNTKLLRPLLLAERDPETSDSRDIFVPTTDLQLGRYWHFKDKFYELIGSGNVGVQRHVVYKPLYDVDLQGNTALTRSLEMFQEVVDRPEFDYHGPRWVFKGEG